MNANSAPEKKDRQSARRAVRAIFILQGHVFSGMRLKQIAEALDTSLPNAYRDMETLADEGVAERIPGHEERWRLTPRLIRVSTATNEEFARLRERVTEFEQRISREP